MKRLLVIFSLFLICSIKAQTVLEVRGELIDLMVNHDFDIDKLKVFHV